MLPIERGKAILLITDIPARVCELWRAVSG